MKSTSPLTTQSLFVIITGAVNSGKSFQLLSILSAEVDGQPVATPTLFLVCESSSEGTIGAILNDPSRACVWPVKDCEEANEAIGACFPRSGPITLGAAKAAWYAWACKVTAAEHAAAVKLATETRSTPPAPPAPPIRLAPSPSDGEVLRSVTVDSATTLYRGSCNTAKRLHAEAARKKNHGAPVVTVNKKEDPGQNDMNLHQYAARVCQDMIDRLNAVTAHRGTMVFVTCHTGPAVQVIQGSADEPPIKMTCGETPSLGTSPSLKAGITVPSFSKTWDALAAKANVIVHAFADVADYAATSLADINAEHTRGTQFGLITERGVNYPRLGPVLWVKRQDGEGPWGYLAAMPRYWHPAVPAHDPNLADIAASPSIGAMLVFSIGQYRKSLAA